MSVILFRPSQRMLEEIALKERVSREDENHSINYAVLPRSMPEHALVSFIAGLHHQIANFYGVGLEHLRISGAVGLLASVALQNAQYHGRGDYIVHGLFMGSQGLCQGFRDEGNFFKRRDVKEKFEGRVLMEERDLEGPRAFGAESHGIGVKMGVYDESDTIEVDTEYGVLYCVQHRDRILLSEGDNQFIDAKRALEEKRF